MYVRECRLENTGPLTLLDITFPFHQDGKPKPVVLVGKNGTGKTILLSYIADAIIEIAKTAFSQVLLKQQQGPNNPYFRVAGSANVRSGSDYSVALISLYGTDGLPYTYCEGMGTTLNMGTYLSQDLTARFPGVVHPAPADPKTITRRPEEAEKEFAASIACFFPSSRHELPNWLNTESVAEHVVFGDKNFKGVFYTPVICEKGAAINKTWLMDVLTDSLAEVSVSDVSIDKAKFVDAAGKEIPAFKWQLKSDPREVHMLGKCRQNIEMILGMILERDGLGVRRLHRNLRLMRVGMFDSGGEYYVPSIDHLSAGQSILFNIFATVIRYAERQQLSISSDLSAIKGVVIIDEIELHLHADMQAKVLPELIKLFPNVQFVLASHSPLFVLGMRRVFGEDGFQLIEMPHGNVIGVERFSEFQRSFEYYRNTTAFEQSLSERLLAHTKPVVWCEGETDPKYILTALDVLDRQDIRNAIDIEWIGTYGPQGPVNTGASALEAAKRLIMAKPQRFLGKTLLLYDCDKKKTSEEIGNLCIRGIPFNPKGKAKKGIENLLPDSAFADECYTKSDDGQGGYNFSPDKTKLCKYVCEKKDPAHFQGFAPVIDILAEFAGLARHNGERTDT